MGKFRQIRLRDPETKTRKRKLPRKGTPNMSEISSTREFYTGPDGNRREKWLHATKGWRDRKVM